APPKMALFKLMPGGRTSVTTKLVHGTFPLFVIPMTYRPSQPGDRLNVLVLPDSCFVKDILALGLTIGGDVNVSVPCIVSQLPFPPSPNRRSISTLLVIVEPSGVQFCTRIS